MFQIFSKKKSGRTFFQKVLSKNCYTTEFEKTKFCPKIETYLKLFLKNFLLKVSSSDFFNLKFKLELDPVSNFGVGSKFEVDSSKFKLNIKIVTSILNNLNFLCSPFLCICNPGQDHSLCLEAELLYK